MILRNIFPIAVKEIPLAKSDITYNQSNAFSSYYYSMENNVFCFFRNVRREIYLGIGSLSVSCIGKYTFNHYIFHCSLVAIAKGNYFSSLSVLPTSDTVLHNQTKCKLVTLFLLHFPSRTQCGNFMIFQILREINFGDSRSAKSSILTNLEALTFYEFLHLLQAEIYQIHKIQSLYNGKNVNF